MEALITRNMTVANAKGEAETFEKSDEPITIDDVETFRRLNRAGAAIVFVEEAGADELGATDLDKMTKPKLIEYAKAENITVDEAAKKDDILAAIKAAKAA
jgi:hypothetical protein